LIREAGQYASTWEVANPLARLHRRLERVARGLRDLCQPVDRVRRATVSNAFERSRDRRIDIGGDVHAIWMSAYLDGPDDVVIDDRADSLKYETRHKLRGDRLQDRDHLIVGRKGIGAGQRLTRSAERRWFKQEVLETAQLNSWALGSVGVNGSVSLSVIAKNRFLIPT
jgi:hypothetical protein